MISYAKIVISNEHAHATAFLNGHCPCPAVPKDLLIPIRKPSRFLEMRKRQDFGKKRIVICYWPDLP